MNMSRGIDQGLQKIIQSTELDQFDYPFVMDCLQGYKAPRAKLKHLLDIGALLRVKKGLYVLGSHVARHPYCLESLANLIYGPSYVSLEWACQYHGLIPERVEIVTNVTTKRSLTVDTPIRRFSYAHLHADIYPVGVALVEFPGGYQALVATKEKALCDLLMVRRGRCRSLQQIRETLFEDLRVEETDLANLDLAVLEGAYESHPHSAVQYLIEIVKKEKHSNE